MKSERASGAMSSRTSTSEMLFTAQARFMMSWKKVRSSASRRFSALTSVSEKHCQPAPSFGTGLTSTAYSAEMFRLSSWHCSRHSPEFARPCWPATSACAMPQWQHELLVPQPPGISSAWTHCSSSPGRIPRASPLLASPPALTKASLQYTIWRCGFSSAIMPGELSSIAISTGDSPTCVVCSSTRGSVKRPAGRK